jgi:hypothetical protein
MNAKPGVQITARQKITISIVLMLAPASRSIRKVCELSGACQAKNVVQRNFRAKHRPRVNPLSFARKVVRRRFVPKLEVRKPTKERSLQKLEMPDGHCQLVQSPLTIYDFGAEQILIPTILRIARYVLIGIIAQGYCGSR